MKPYAEKFYNSPAWKAVRKAYTLMVGGLCERCKAKGIVEPSTIVHHKDYLTEENINDLTTALSWRNLEALCDKCHNQEHKTSNAEKRYTFAADGSLIGPPPVKIIT